MSGKVDLPGDSAAPAGNHGVPETLLRSLAHAPQGRVAIVMRHAHRGPLLPGRASDLTEITEVGVRAAERLGALLSDRAPGRLVASTSLRCVQTAQALARGARWENPTAPHEDYRLHGAGALVDDPALAYPEFRRLGVDGMIGHLLVQRSPIPGFRSPVQVAEHVIGAALEEDPRVDSTVDEHRRLDVLVSHDIVIAVLLGGLIDVAFHGEHDLPVFLDGVVVWRISPTRVGLSWAGEAHEMDWPPRR